MITALCPFPIRSVTRLQRREVPLPRVEPIGTFPGASVFMVHQQGLEVEDLRRIEGFSR